MTTPRAGLGDAIKQAAQARAALASHDAAIARGRELVTAAEAELEALAAALTAARDEHSALIAEAIGEERELPGSAAIEHALAAEADARCKVEAARTGVERLRGDRKQKELDVVVRDVGVVIAVNALLAPTIAQVIDDAEAAAQTLSRSCAVLDYLQRINLTGAGSSVADREIDDAALTELSRSERTAAQRAKEIIPTELQARARSLNHFGHFIAQFGQLPDIHELVGRWRAARTKLKTDPDAELPEV